MDRCLLQQLKEQLSGLKLELFEVCRSILCLTEDTTVQTNEETTISKGIFSACLHIRKLLSTMPPVTPAIATSAPTFPTAKEGGIRLPMVEIPKFDRNIMNRKAFWEQHSASINSKPRLTDPEELA